MLARPRLLFKSQKSKKTAQIILKKHKGEIPNNFDDLKALPGIGNYTASAILAIAFNEPYIPLDGNIERVLKRYLYLKKKVKLRKKISRKKNLFLASPIDLVIMHRLLWK